MSSDAACSPFDAQFFFVRSFMVIDDKGGEIVIIASDCFFCLSIVSRDMYCSCSLLDFELSLLYLVELRQIT